MTDAPVHYVHEEKADGFGTVRIRPVDAEADAAVLHGWVSAERASFWGMNGLTRDQVAEVYAHMVEPRHPPRLPRRAGRRPRRRTPDLRAVGGPCQRVLRGRARGHRRPCAARARRGTGRAAGLVVGADGRLRVVRAGGAGPAAGRGRSGRAQREGPRPLRPPGLRGRTGRHPPGDRPAGRPPAGEDGPTRLPQAGGSLPRVTPEDLVAHYGLEPIPARAAGSAVPGPAPHCRTAPPPGPR